MVDARIDCIFKIKAVKNSPIVSPYCKIPIYEKINFTFQINMSLST